MASKFREPNFKGKNKLFRHEVHNIRLGVGYTVIGKHTIRLLVDRLTAEEERKIADHTQANAESIMHMEICDLALTYGNREFLVLKRALEPLCLTTKITLHYYQRIAKILLQAFADHIECDSYFALLNLTMALARDIGKLFIPFFDLFSKALMRGLYDKETGSMFIAKTDRVQLTFTALSALVIGIGGIVSTGLSSTAVTSGTRYTNEDEDDMGATYERSFMPSIPAANELSDEQKTLLSSMRRVVALVVQRTFRDTKEYIRRLGAEVIAALCRRHARLLPLALSVCTQAVGVEVRAARAAKTKSASFEDDEDNNDGEDASQEGEEEEKEANGGEDEGDNDAAEELDDDEEDAAKKTLTEEEINRPILPEDLQSSAIADSMHFLTRNLLIGIKGALTTNFESSMASILNALIHQSLASEESNAALCPQSLHSIATHVACGTFASVITSIRNDQTNTSIPRILNSLVEQLLPSALRHLEGELYAAAHRHVLGGPSSSSSVVAVGSSSPSGVHAPVAHGYAVRYLRVALSAVSAANQIVLNRAGDNEETTAAVKTLTEGLIAILKSARGFIKPKTGLPPNLPLLFADALTVAQSLLLTDVYGSPDAMKLGETFVAAILAESGRMLQAAMATNDKTCILTIVNTVKDFFQDVSQKSVAHASRFGQRTDADGGLSMPCLDEFIVAVFVVLTAKVANGQLESGFRRDFIDSLMVMAEIAQSTLVSASASGAHANFPHMLSKIVNARIPPAPNADAAKPAKGAKGGKQASTSAAQGTPRLISAVFVGWMNEDISAVFAEISNGTFASNEEHFLGQVARVSVWLSLMPAIDQKVVGCFEECVGAAGDLLAAGGQKTSKVHLSAKLRTRLLQLYVRGSAALSRQTGDTVGQSNAAAASKLSAIIHQIAASIPKGFRAEDSSTQKKQQQQRQSTKPATESDAEANNTTISLLLAAFDRLRTSTAANNNSSSDNASDSTGPANDKDASLWIDQCIAPEAYSDFVFVLMHSLATTKSPSTRLSTLVLLKDCYTYQHRVAASSSDLQSSASLPPFAMASLALRKSQSGGSVAHTMAQSVLATDLGVFDLLIRCEKVDPLSEGLDAKANVLAPIVFDAANTTNFFERYYGRSDAFMIQTLVRYCFGSINVKFAPMWTIAVRIIGNMLRQELVKKADNALSLWTHLAQPLIVASALGNREGSTYHALSNAATDFSEDVAPVTAVLTQGLYQLTFDESQLHASGALVSKAFRQISAESVRARQVHKLNSGQRLTLSDVAFGAEQSSGEHALSQSTDSATVTRVLLNALMTLSDHIHHSREVHADTKKGTAAAIAVLSFPEQLVLRLAESDVGATFDSEDEDSLGLTAMPSTSNAKALSQRLEMSILSMSAQYSLNSQTLANAGVAPSLIARRKEVLEAALLQYVCSSDSRLQAASVEGLRKMGVAPYSKYSDFLFPICGGRLTIADFTTNKNKSGNNKKGTSGVDSAPKRLGTSNAKSALTFLQSFSLEASISEEDRVSYITAMLLLCLPVLTSTGRAGSGGNAQKKVRDREVLGRKVFALLSRVKTSDAASAMGTVVHADGGKSSKKKSVSGSGKNSQYKLTNEDPLALVVDVLLERILQLPPLDPSAEDPMSRYDLCLNLVNEGNKGSVTTMTIPKLRRKYEQLTRRLVSAVKLLQALVPAVGTRFLEYSQRCFLLLLHTYEASMPSNVVQRAGLEGTVRLPGESGNAIRRNVVGLMRGLLDAYPAAIAEFFLGNAKRTSLFVNTLESIYSHAPLVASSGTNSVGIRGGTTAPLPPPIEVSLTLSHHVELFPFIAASAETLLLPAIERYFRQTASDAVVLAVLDIVGHIVARADERLPAVHMPADGKLIATTMRKGLLEPNGEAIFSSLHRFVTVTSESVLTEVPLAKKDRPTGSVNPLRVSPKIWKDVILLASALPEYIRGGNSSAESLERNMSQLLEIAINFARSPVCATDRASADMAAETIESIIKQVPRIHPTNHFRRLMHLFNNVTAPIARTVLCAALKIAVTKIEGMTDLATMLQLQAVARCVACMNAFSRSDADADEVPAGSKRSRKDEEREGDNEEDEDNVQQQNEADDLDALDFSRYDFELRYHAFYSITSFFNKSSGEKGAPTTAVGKTNKALATSRKERQYAGEHDVEIPLTVEQPRLTMEAAALLALNFLFFIRDRERTIRTFAGESLHALIKYVSRYPIFTGAEDDTAVDNISSVPAQADPLNQLIRPVLLPAFRRGIVSKDSSSRLEHMQGFGYLAQHLPIHFPSLAMLYSPNSEASFYSCIGSAQHRVRMNALNSLRKKCGQMHQREVLRVFVPFIVTYLKDYAQGKQDARSEQISEAKQKGFADSLLQTLAGISAHMPWEGYHRILSLLLREAKDHEALRAVMLKGIVRVLESFHFLETDVTTGERRIASKVEEWSDDDEEGETSEKKGENVVEDPTQDVNDAAAELATSALTPSARAERKNIRIMSILEEEVLPQLYAFILSQKRAPKSKDLEGTLNESNKGMKNQDRKNEPKASVQLPVAVGILKIIRLFPQHRFDHHVDILLNEIVLKLRTKNDKQRETARNVLFAMMNEAGPQKLRFVVTKLRDNLVHGYQLHVLGYTLVGLLHSMFGFAGEKATVVAPQEEENEAENEAEDDGDSDSDDEEDGDTKKKGENEEDSKDDSKDDNDKLATTDGKKALNGKKPATPPKAIMPYTPADEKRIIGKAFRMGGTRRRIFSAEESTAALDAVMSDLFDVFVDDYLGEVGEQKEQTELISTLREVKHNKSLQGFSFLAMYCSGENVMDMFVTKIRWVLAPPTTKELVKNTSNSAHVMGDNSKYMHGGKRRAADARFVERVRVLAVRVAKALVLNNTLSLGTALTSSLTMLNRNNTLREAKIAEFEAKDGTRRIRGNIDQFTAAKKLTLKEQRDKNYVVEERPDRIDFDFSSHTVLATQHKQKLRVYKGGYAKNLKETSKGFRTEDAESAVVLDTLDEFNLKFLLLLLKKALGIGRAVTKTKRTKIVTEAAAEGEEGAEEDAAAANAEHERELAAAVEGGEEDEAGLVGATDSFEEGYDEMELFERLQRREDELGEGRAVKKNEAKAAKQAKAEQTLAELFGAEHKGQLSELLVPVLAILQGEGADSVITTGFEVTHALLAINPPLPAVQTSGQVLFDVIADLFDRGGEVKPRAMRVLSALVQHTYFSISNEQALWITKVARGEVIERSKYVTMGLGLLQAVVNKRVEIVEVYELIDSVTELMMHKASSPPVRNRCVSIIAKFITEYRITMEKLQSHMNMYVQNLQYPNVDGRLAMLELLGVLVFRLPQQVLRQEANVLFIPLVHCMAESPWASCQEKAAVVIQSLVLNAGVDLVAKTITVWLQSETIKTREYAMQVLAVILPILPQLYGADATEEGVAHDPQAKAERFEIVKAATEWAISELQLAIVYDHPLSKNKQQQIKEEIQREVASKAGAGGKKRSANEISAEDITLMVSRRIRVEKEMASWSFIFFSLRAVEALTVISPSFASYFAEGENAVILEHLAKSLVPHSHPWVRSAATRVFNNYLKGYAFAAAPYGDSTVRWVALDKKKAAAQSHATTGTKAFLVLPTSVHNGVVTVNASVDEVREVQENAKRVCKQLIVVIANSDVRDELHYGYRAIDDPFRTVLVEATSSLARIISITAILLSDTSALASVWSQLQSMIEPILSGRSVRGYLVRSASMIQLLANLVKGLPFASMSASAAEGGSTVSTNLVSSIVDVPQLETIIVPFAGICAESTEISHRIAEFGLATIEVMKTVVSQHGPEFEGVVLASSDAAREGARKSKKRKAEAGSGSILAMAAAEAAYSRSAHAAVALALTKITDEIKERQKRAKLAEMHERNFKKAQRQQESAEKYAAMNQKRTGGKRRSRYA